MALDIDELQIQITAQASKAVNAINKLAKSLRYLSETDFDADNLKSYVREISALGRLKGLEKVANNLTAIAKATSKLQTPSNLSSQMQDLIKGSASAEDSLYRPLRGVKGNATTFAPLIEQLKSLNEAGKNTDGIVKVAEALERMAIASTQLKGAASAIAQVNRAIQNIGSTAQVASDEVEDLGTTVSEASVQGGFISGVMDRVRSVFARVSSVISGVKDELKSLGAPIAPAIASFKKLFETFKRVALMRAMRYAIREIVEALKEGIQNLVDWDATYGNNTSHAVETMTEIKSLALQIKNTLGAMAMPIIQLLLPALRLVSQALMFISNVINQVVRAFQGYSDYMKATYQEVSAVTDETKRASASLKELKRVLFGFDELNVLPSPDRSSGGSGIGAMNDINANMFVPTEIASPLKELGDLTRQTWEDLKKNLEPYFDPQYWSDLLGDPLGALREAWETFKYDMQDAWYTLCDNLGIDWDATWDGITNTWEKFKSWFTLDSINQEFADLKKIADDVWGWISKAASDTWGKVTEVWGGVKGWVSEKLIQPLKDAWAWISENIFSPLSEAWKDAKKAASDAWEGIKKPFKTAGEWFKTTFSEAWRLVKGVFTGDSEVIREIKEGISQTFTNIVNKLVTGINSIVAKPFNAINGVLEKIRDVSIFGFEPFKNIAKTIPVPQIPLLKMAQGGVIPNQGSVGTLFYAGEAGAEVVANMGHSTGVMNVSQMQEAVASGNVEVVNAVYAMANMIASAVNNKNFDVYMDASKVGQSVSKYQYNQARRGTTQGAY